MATQMLSTVDISRALRDAKPIVYGRPTAIQRAGLDVHRNCAIEIAEVFARTFARFDRAQFMTDCGCEP
jgi:hypothetical protein